MGHSNLAYVMVSVIIKFQLIINDCLLKDVPGQINEVWSQMYRHDINVLQLVRIAQSVKFLTTSDTLVLSQYIAGSNLTT